MVWNCCWKNLIVTIAVTFIVIGRYSSKWFTSFCCYSIQGQLQSRLNSMKYRKLLISIWDYHVLRSIMIFGRLYTHFNVNFPCRIWRSFFCYIVHCIISTGYSCVFVCLILFILPIFSLVLIFVIAVYSSCFLRWINIRTLKSTRRHALYIVAVGNKLPIQPEV